jgi:hypothetical protein
MFSLNTSSETANKKTLEKCGIIEEQIGYAIREK